MQVEFVPIASGLGSAVAVGLALAAMRKLAPVDEPDAGAGGERSLEELQPDYRRYEWVQLAAIFGGMLLLAYPLARALELLFGLGWSSGQDELLVRPTLLAWVCVSFPVGLVLGGLLGDLMLQRHLGSRWQEFQRYSSLRHRMDPKKAERVLVPAVAVGALLASLAITDWYVRITPSEFVYDGFFDVFEVRHDWTELREILTSQRFEAPNGNIVTRRHFILVFADGDRWCTQWLPGEFSEIETEDIIAKVARESGVMPSERRLLPNDAGCY